MLYSWPVKILLIEDDRQTADYIAKGLREHGHVVDKADNGRDGLYMATGEAYDVMVVDRNLPQMDGLSLVKAAAASGTKTPVLFLTTMGGVDDRVAGLEGRGRRLPDQALRLRRADGTGQARWPAGRRS
jgi:two-component system OmpR family response regulator